MVGLCGDSLLPRGVYQCLSTVIHQLNVPACALL